MKKPTKLKEIIKKIKLKKLDGETEFEEELFDYKGMEKDAERLIREKLEEVQLKAANRLVRKVTSISPKHKPILP